MLFKETTVFVEHLFRCLESESYMKGEDPPPPTSNPKQPTPTPVHPPPTSVRSADKRNSNVVSSPAVSKAETNDRRMSEDFRHKEVKLLAQNFTLYKTKQQQQQQQQQKSPMMQIFLFT